MIAVKYVCTVMLLLACFSIRISTSSPQLPNPISNLLSFIPPPSNAIPGLNCPRTVGPLNPFWSKQAQNLFLSYYSGSTTIVYSLNSASRGLMESPSFDQTLPIVIIVHGYLGDSNDIFLTQLANEIHSLSNSNVLQYDHSALTRTDYASAVANRQYAGEALAKVLADLYSYGVRNFHLIGFSIGTHINGFAGREFLKLTGVKINRITGLDPAGPCFYKFTDDQRLTRSDADFVDIIHTNMGGFGISEPIGHVDFFPNGGFFMPGCLETLCSHTKSIVYYTESVKNVNGFRAVLCPSWLNFNLRGCTGNTRISMGYALQNNVPHGNYYLKTSFISLFGLGDAGVL